jgi:hypothetical protein
MCYDRISGTLIIGPCVFIRSIALFIWISVLGLHIGLFVLYYITLQHSLFDSPFYS